MSKVFVSENHLYAIAEAIREKLETDETFRPGEMAGAIAMITGGGHEGTKIILKNGTYTAADDGLDGYSLVQIEVVPDSRVELAYEIQGKTGCAGILRKKAMTGRCGKLKGAYYGAVAYAGSSSFVNEALKGDAGRAKQVYSFPFGPVGIIREEDG